MLHRLLKPNVSYISTNVLVKIKYLAKETFLAFFVLRVALLVSIIIVICVFVPLGFGGRPFDELIQFAAVQPDAAALGTVIDLDTLSVTDQQRHIAIRAVHGFSSSKIKRPTLV
jgi:hypothetical protein